MRKGQFMAWFIIAILVIALADATDGQEVATSQSQARPIAVGIIHISPVSDGGWTTAHDASLRLALAEFGEAEGQFEGAWQPVEHLPHVLMPYRVLADGEVLIEVSVVESVAPEAFWGTAEQMLSALDVELLISTAENYCGDTYDLAAEYPNKYFATIHCDYESEAENVASYFGRSFEGTYVAAAALAQLSRTGIACFVGAYEENGQVATNLAGFARGVIDHYPGKAQIAARFTGSWFDPAAEIQAAESCPGEYDIAGIHQDGPAALSVFTEDGVYAMGYDSDQSQFGALVSVVWDWTPIYTPVIEGALYDTFPSGRHWPGMAEGVVQLAWNPEAPDDMVDFAEELADQIETGELKIFDLSDEEVWNLTQWRVAAGVEE